MRRSDLLLSDGSDIQMRLVENLIGLSALSLIAACSSVYDPVLPTGQDGRVNHEIEVVQDTEVLELPASAGEQGLPYYQMGEIRYFLSEYNQRGRRHGPLVVSVPQNSPYASQYENGIQQMLRIADEYGVRDIQRSDYNSNGSPDAPMVLAFTAYRAIAPDCPALNTINMAATVSNDPSPAFGCFMQANLAAMISDPADLLGARRADPSDTLRRIQVLDRYRAGESTATERTDSESGAVSQAID
tara:strand:- start:20437 stop:21168 length:732 start_codon:yes stop_codon:yes gene_type:complete